MGFLTFGFTGIIILLAWGVRIFIIVLLIKALMKYLNDKKATPEQEIIRRSLGEALKAHRQQSGMTQEYVAEALSPAKVISVVMDGERSCKVTVSPDQLSLAIGKEGQNARLAARLTGYKIDIKPASQAEE